MARIETPLGTADASGTGLPRRLDVFATGRANLSTRRSPTTSSPPVQRPEADRFRGEDREAIGHRQHHRCASRFQLSSHRTVRADRVLPGLQGTPGPIRKPLGRYRNMWVRTESTCRTLMCVRISIRTNWNAEPGPLMGGTFTYQVFRPLSVRAGFKCRFGAPFRARGVDLLAGY